jgi:hypothetical protein
MANFPTNPKPSNITIGSHYQNNVSTSFSFNRQVATRGGHRWSFKLNFPPQLQTDFTEMFSFLHGLKGRYGTCTFQLPNYSTQSTLTLDTGITEMTVADTIANGQQISIDGLAEGAVIKKGDFFHIEGSEKKYMVSSDHTVTASEVTDGATISFCPSLVVSAPAGNSITFNADFTVSLESDDLMINFSPDKIMSTSIQLIEVLATTTGSQY